MPWVSPFFPSFILFSPPPEVFSFFLLTLQYSWDLLRGCVYSWLDSAVVTHLISSASLGHYLGCACSSFQPQFICPLWCSTWPRTLVNLKVHEVLPHRRQVFCVLTTTSLSSGCTTIWADLGLTHHSHSLVLFKDTTSSHVTSPRHAAVNTDKSPACAAYCAPSSSPWSRSLPSPSHILCKILLPVSYNPTATELHSCLLVSPPFCRIFPGC